MTGTSARLVSVCAGALAVSLGGGMALLACGHSGGAASPGDDAGPGADGSMSSFDAAVDATPDASMHPPGDSASDAPAEAVSDAGGNACVPFAMPPTAALFGSTKRVFAHYFYPFPLSIDDKPAASDYYNLEYLAPDGESDKWLARGGYLRQRPLPVPVGSAATYAVDNMEREVRLAIAGGITLHGRHPGGQSGRRGEPAAEPSSGRGGGRPAVQDRGHARSVRAVGGGRGRRGDGRRVDHRVGGQ